MKDVAEHAGVSARTVSNVVNNYVHVSPQMRDLVQRSLIELGYQMDYVAKGLRSGRTGLIALVLPNLSEPYFAKLAEAVIQAAHDKHLNVLVEISGGDPEVEVGIMRGARATLADGVLLISAASAMTGASCGAVVMMGEHAAFRELQYVGIDNVAAARTVVNHLLERGYGRIAALGAQDTDVGRQRYRGYQLALADSGKEETRPLELVDHDWSPQAGYDAVLRMLRHRTKRPDAIFAFNDSLGIGALRALQAKQITVPEQVAVAGIDDIPQSAFASPPLTTVAPDLDELAGRAVDLLDSQLEGRGGGPPYQPTLTSFKLIVRASTDLRER